MNDFKGIIEDVEKSSLVSDKVIEKVIEIIGQEKWQDINDEKSDICTTEGELIITLKGIPELEKENAELTEKYNRVDIIGYDALKNLTKAKERIRALLFHLTNDTFYVTFETQEQSVERARQFLRGRKE